MVARYACSEGIPFGSGAFRGLVMTCPVVRGVDVRYQSRLRSGRRSHLALAVQHRHVALLVEQPLVVREANREVAAGFTPLPGVLVAPAVAELQYFFCVV